MNKKLVIILGFIFLCIGTALVQFKMQTPQKKTIQRPFFVVKQIIQGDSNKIQITSGTTALQLLQMGHKVVMTGQGINAFVTGIDGQVSDSQKKEFWAFYVNGKQAQVGAGSYFLKNNDTIEWKVETY
jgi:hypothetical protein